MTPVWFVDTNVVIDVLTARPPFFAEARVVFEAARQGQVRLVTTITSLATAYYIGCRATHDAQLTTRVLRELTKLLTIAPATDAIVAEALVTDWPDFEDALQYFAARATPAVSAIITRDPAGFQLGLLPVLSPAAALQQLT